MTAAEGIYDVARTLRCWLSTMSFFAQVCGSHRVTMWVDRMLRRDAQRLQARGERAILKPLKIQKCWEKTLWYCRDLQPRLSRSPLLRALSRNPLSMLKRRISSAFKRASRRRA
jgi:hypothetical protein